MCWPSPVHNMSQFIPSPNAAYLTFFSHQSTTNFSDFQALFPAKPVMATEYCGCKSQRLEDSDLPTQYTPTITHWILPDPTCVQHDEMLAAYSPAFSVALLPGHCMTTTVSRH